MTCYDLTPGCSQKGAFLVFIQPQESKPNPHGMPRSRQNLSQRHCVVLGLYMLAKSDKTRN